MCDHGSVKGGAENVAIASAVGLHQAGVPTYFFCGGDPTDPRLQNLPSERIVSIGGGTFHESQSRLKSLKNFYWNRRAAEAMQDLLDRISGPAIVHLHSFVAVVTPSILKPTLAKGAKTVLTLHDYGVACPTSGLYNHQRKHKCPLRPMSLRCILTQCSKRSYFSKAALVSRMAMVNARLHPTERIDEFICVSPRNGEVVRPYLRHGAPITFVHNPIETVQSERVSAENNKTFLFVGRLTSEKDPVRLASAARRLNIPVKFVGDGPLRGAVANANPNAEITGWVSIDQVAQIWNKARANVMTSRWHEGNPLTLSEAGSRGVPSLVPSDMCGAEFVLPGETGERFELESDESLDSRLASLLDDEYVKGLSSGVYERYWADPPNMQRHLRELLPIYERLAMPSTQ